VSLNKTKGNMYPWTTHTWNPIKGKCPHECVYCYMNRFPQGGLRLDEKCLKDNLGKVNTIFVGSSTDMFAWSVLPDWILKVLNHCRNYPINTYLFQSKNPHNMYKYEPVLPLNVIVGTTIETNRPTSEISKAPYPRTRLAWLDQFSGIPKMLSIEPIMDFDLDVFITCIKQVKPSFVSIGADSKNHGLPEPPAGKIREFIQELQKFTEVKVKANLKRLMK